MRTLVFAAAAATWALSSGAAWAEQWRVVASDDVHIMSIDQDDIKASGSRSSFTVLTVPHTPEAWDYSVSRFEVDCATDMVRPLWAVAYRSDGTVFETYEGPGTAGPVVPGTIAESWRNAICRDAWRYDVMSGSVADGVKVLKALRDPI